MVRTPGLASSRHRRSASATILPASRISASSRGDFSSGALDKRERNTCNPVRLRWCSVCRLSRSESRQICFRHLLPLHFTAARQDLQSPAQPEGERARWTREPLDKLCKAPAPSPLSLFVLVRYLQQLRRFGPEAAQFVAAGILLQPRHRSVEPFARFRLVA